MPNFYERVIAIPDQATDPAGREPLSCAGAGYAPAIPAGQILILSGDDAGM